LEVDLNALIKKKMRKKHISWIQDTMHPDKVPLAFGIKIAPHHHIPFTIPRDWHGFISVSLIDGLNCIER